MTRTELDPRERFLRAIAERIPAERIAEIHLFPALRSGGRESAVAVIAAMADERYEQGVLPSPVGEGEGEGEGAEHEAPAGASGESVPDAGPPPDIEDAAGGDEIPHPIVATHDRFDAADRPARLVVYRAVYRWTRKGPDRGKWEMDLTAEADAPLGAVAEVVRGVQRRAGDDGEPELITSDALRVALSDRPWAGVEP